MVGLLGRRMAAARMLLAVLAVAQCGAEGEEKGREENLYPLLLGVRSVHDAAKCQIRLRTEAMIAAQVGERSDRDAQLQIYWW